MRGVSTFGAFTTARLGIYAAQKGLDVTGHNITNINTRGYTRQRLDQMSLRMGGNDRYASQYDTRIGSGVLCTGVSQLRDPYLDIRYRNEQSSVGSMDAKLSGLEDLSKIFDEISKGDGKGDGVLEAKLNDLMTQLQNLSKNPNQQDKDSTVRSVADALTGILNDYAKQLDTIKENQDNGFRQDVKTVNDILKNISTLNESIMKSEIHGDPALELRDQRNLLIDELSGYVKISVEYENVQIGAGKTVEKLKIRLAGTTKGGPNDQTTLVDGDYARAFSLRQEATKNPNYDANLPTTDPNYQAQYLDANGQPTDDLAAAKMQDSPNYNLDLGALTNRNGTTTGNADPVLLGDLDLYGALQASREILTEAGEFTVSSVINGIPGIPANPGPPPTPEVPAVPPVDLDAAGKRGIPYYEKSLDALANKLATLMNETNTGYLTNADGNYVDKTTGEPLAYRLNGVGDPLFINKDTDFTTFTPDQLTYFNDNSKPYGGALFSNNGSGNDTTGITAANISVSAKWDSGEVRIVNSTVQGSDKDDKPGEPNSTANDNILNMMLLMTSKHEFTANETSPGSINGDNSYFKGSFQEMLGNTCSTLANDKRSTITLLNNYASSATELDVNRSSVSGVDLNDEASSLMQYQKSYSAACRLMTTLDEALDKLINGTGVVGR